jgi:hypothetical protein
MVRETYTGAYYEVGHSRGSLEFIPCDVHPGAETNDDLQLYVEGEVDNPEDAPVVKEGTLTRFTAPGYLDCTPWELVE